MASPQLDWRRGVDRLYILLWATWSVALATLLLVIPDTVSALIRAGVFLIGAVVVPALGRRALGWVVDGFLPGR